MLLRTILLACIGLLLSACNLSDQAEKGWIKPSNDLERKLVRAAERGDVSAEEEFGAALRDSKEVFFFVAHESQPGDRTIAMWLPLIKGKTELAVYTSKERLKASPRLSLGPAAWVGMSGRDTLLNAAGCGDGIVVNYGLLPMIEISPEGVRDLLTKQELADAGSKHCRDVPMSQVSSAASNGLPAEGVRN